ncbi:MAG: AgmX/PglI C-terminal domain-containing protein [Bacteriovoracaceae bacterium]|nr:AgmX/PglI C-terminal domain-containing protein [Bacteriovoracaceae bacterium]
MTTTEIDRNLFQVRGSGIKSRALGNGRYVIGSLEHCEIVIPLPSVQPIHAILEITGSKAKIYDLTGEGQVQINNRQSVVSDLQPNDFLKIGNCNFSFLYFQRDKDDPTNPVILQNVLKNELEEFNRKNVTRTQLKISDIQKNEERPIDAPPHRKENIISEARPTTHTSKDDQIPTGNQTETQGNISQIVNAPYVLYPFDKEYNFESSEYIFEDNENLYPIFHYDTQKTAIEVIILFKNKLFSIDYLIDRDGTYFLSGKQKNANQIEYPYLPRFEKNEFIECRNKKFSLYRLNGYQLRAFTNNPEKLNDTAFELSNTDIVQLSKNDIMIVVKHVQAPPSIDNPPALSRDKSMLWLFWIVMALVTIPAILFSYIDVKKDELKKDKAPERIAKVLLKTKNPFPKENVKAEKVNLPKDLDPIQDQPKPGPVKDVVVQDSPKEVEPQKGSQSKKTAENKKAKNNKNKKGSEKSRVTQTNTSPTPKNRGTVDVFEGDKFVSTVNSLVAKGGSYKGVRAEGKGSSYTGTTSADLGPNREGNVTAVKVSDQLGSELGKGKGAETFKSGAGGLAKGKGLYSASIPTDTVVLGSMDPDLIRKILREHIPQFRFCYQKELDNSGGKFQGVIKLSFVIGATGSVSKAGVLQSSGLPPEVKSCVINVLEGIQFPSPKGGGVVEVVQPFNFYSSN